MGHFGSRVIGTKRAAEEAVVAEVRADHFGPRVIGEVLRRRRAIAGISTADDANAEAAEKDTRSDPKKKKKKRAKKAKKAEAKVEATGVATPEEKSELRAKADLEDVEVSTTTIEELQKALADNPTFYEPLYRSEFARASGPRKTALRIFLLYEMDHENRDSRKLEIEEAIEGKRAK
jgi:hypothetical protein